MIERRRRKSEVCKHPPFLYELLLFTSITLTFPQSGSFVQLVTIKLKLRQINYELKRSS